MDDNVSPDFCDAGKVKLERVVLKPSAFDELGLPITVVKGNAEIIDFEIPWKSIQSSPVVITIKGLSVVLGPNITEQGKSITARCRSAFHLNRL